MNRTTQGKFCTAINCMDGRVQVPVAHYLKKRFRADYVDAVTESGPNRILAANDPPALVASILRRVEISVMRYFSVGVAVVGHEDCDGNPASKAEQFLHLRLAINRVARAFPEVPVVALWVDVRGNVEEIPFRAEKA